jgi:hypothetical protein
MPTFFYAIQVDFEPFVVSNGDEYFFSLLFSIQQPSSFGS